MRFNSNLGAAVLGLLIVSAAMPALAAGKHFAQADKMAEKVEMKKPDIKNDGGLGKTNTGGTAACPVTIACVVNGVIVTGPASAACNGGRAQPVQQCLSKAKK
jgi:hypothetical protein